jgi:methyltransferase (TIGR00027 family)
MARTDDDTWDLASSVGATATMVAVGRALATAEPSPLITDPFAEPLVRAVGVEFFTRLLDGDIDAGDAQANALQNVQRMTDSMAVRTKFFDEFFRSASATGVGQAVILAAGLDSRAYRLKWPAGTVVFEVDQPDVIEFKTTTMSSLGAVPTAERRAVAVDLRDDWPKALRDSGFDESRPTAWSAEGLLMYLPPQAQDRLFDDITALSAPGSRLATEFHPDGGEMLAKRAQTMSSRWSDLGFDVNISELFYFGDRSHVVDYLTGAGWRADTRTRPELFADYGRDFPDDEALAPFRNTISVIATRNEE